MLFAKATQELGTLIIVKRPAFRDEYDHVYPFPKLLLENISDRNPFGCYSDSIYLWEVEPNVFRGNVPIGILKATLTAKTLGFKPYVWLASPQSELGMYLESPTPRVLTLDPAIVAYPIVGKESGRDVINNEYGIVLGIWGKDIEQIDKALEASNDASA